MVSMTGKELIIYILQNDLENEVVFANGMLTCMMTETEAAIKFKVGVSTVRAWYQLGMISGFMFGDVLYFRKDAQDPRTKTNKGVDCNG